MCLATPSKIVKIDGDWATVNAGKHKHKANLSLVKDAKVGDYVIVHGDLVLNKIQKQEALKILGLLSAKGGSASGGKMIKKLTPSKVEGD